MLQVLFGGVTVEAAQGEADGDALGEGFEVGHLQPLTQAGLSGQEQGQTAGAVPVEVGEKRKKGQDVGA